MLRCVECGKWLLSKKQLCKTCIVLVDKLLCNDLAKKFYRGTQWKQDNFKTREDEGMLTSKDIVEIIMTQHELKGCKSDVCACHCWICRAGRDTNCSPRKDYLHMAYPTLKMEEE